MTSDLPLFRDGSGYRPGFGPLVTPKTRIERRWRTFHLANPHIGTELLRRANEAFKGGAQRVSVKALFEVVRADARFKTEPDRWKLDNSLTSIFGRWLVHVEPSLARVIELRARKERAVA